MTRTFILFPFGVCSVEDCLSRNTYQSQTERSSCRKTSTALTHIEGTNSSSVHVLFSPSETLDVMTAVDPVNLHTTEGREDKRRRDVKKPYSKQ